MKDKLRECPFCLEKFGKTVFSTKAEAEEALKRMQYNE